MQIYNDFAKYQIPDLPSEQERTITITKKTEIMRKSIIIY